MKTSSIKIGSNIFSCYVTETQDEQQMGLMYVKPPPPIMVFPYKTAQELKFWMKNTPSPLDIIFCLNGKVSQIKEGKPNSTELISGGNSNLVIEMPKGHITKFNIKIGDLVELG